MFIGHIAVGLAAKKVAPKASLGTLLMSVQFLDLLWPILLLLDVEHFRVDPGNTAFTPLDFYDYPFSHSLLTVLGWSLLFGLVYYGVRKNRTTAIILGMGVLSHWVLDVISHRADLPLIPGVDMFVGLGLWNSVTATILVELALYIAGVFVYLSCTKPKDKLGTVAFSMLAGFFFIVWVANFLSPPPPGEKAVAITGLLFWLIVPLANWIDGHRQEVVR